MLGQGQLQVQLNGYRCVGKTIMMDVLADIFSLVLPNFDDYCSHKQHKREAPQGW